MKMNGLRKRLTLIILLLTHISVATKILEETIQNNTNNSHVSNHCIDFYETACGEWEKLNPLPKDDASLTTLQRMGMNVDNYFWKIIANDSYYKEDRRLQSARAFYKSCVNSRNSNTTRDSRHHLIHRYFGGWELIPSHSTNINNTNKHKQNKMNNGLTNLFLPILTQTGRSPLFSINIADDIFAVIVSTSTIYLISNFFVLYSMFLNLLRTLVIHVRT
uniref:Peptidase_M13_N domain-containing protein n=1 Tax=Schistosoma mansoni TaxID=6183 RepID=A0A3Q0KT27_SCHMA